MFVPKILVVGLLVTVLTPSQGYGSQGNKNRVKRIIGGKATCKGDYPYLTSIWVRGDKGPIIFRGGVLLRNNWVVSTAHGLKPERKTYLTVKLGVYNKLDASQKETCYVEKLILHPDFNKTTLLNDIMLLKLVRCKGKRSKNVKPVEINTDPACPIVGQTVTAIGWGRTKEHDKSSTTDVPHEVNLKVFDTKWSLKQFERLEKGFVKSGYDVQTMIFAGKKTGGADACQGDSGGPLVATCGNSKVPVGLVSFGFNCGHADSPGVYTRLSAFKTWIDNTIKLEENTKDATKKSG